MTGKAFHACVEQFLVPELKPGDVMDKLAAHKVAGVRETIRAARASVMLLPASSPDLNPIFARLKAGLRKAAARTREALRDTVGQLLANSGYEFE